MEDHGKGDPYSMPQSETQSHVMCVGSLLEWLIPLDHTSIESWWQVPVPFLASPPYRVLCRTQRGLATMELLLMGSSHFPWAVLGNLD